MLNGQDWSEETYTQAEQAIGYVFRNKELLKTCFTHSTYRNNVAHGGEDNERLEFLGDAVLQFVVSDNLYHGRGKAMEGKLTDLRKGYVSEYALTPLAEKLGLMKYLRHANQESDLGGEEGKIRSNLFEAIVAGIYLDGGLDAAREFLERNLAYCVKPDYISDLQTYVQAMHAATPQYDIREEKGGFSARVTALGAHAEGWGRNKQTARYEAAQRLLQKLKEKEKQ